MNIYKLIICLLGAVSLQAASNSQALSRNQPQQIARAPIAQTFNHNNSVLTKQLQLPPAMSSRIYAAVINGTIEDLTEGERALIKHYRYQPDDVLQGNRSIAHLAKTPEQVTTILKYAPDILSATCNHEETPLHCYAKISNSRLLIIALDHLQQRLSPQAFAQLINTKNKAGESPFFVAASNDKWSYLPTLLAYGAIPQTENLKTTLEQHWKKRDEHARKRFEQKKTPVFLPHLTYEYAKKQYDNCLAQHKANLTDDEPFDISETSISTDDSIFQPSDRSTSLSDRSASLSDRSTTLSDDAIQCTTPTNNQDPFRFSAETIETFDQLPRAIQIQHLQGLLQRIKA